MHLELLFSMQPSYLRKKKKNDIQRKFQNSHVQINW